MNMSTFGPVPPFREDIVSAAHKALSELGGQPKLVILFAPSSADQQMIISSVRTVADIPLVGATNGGAAFTEKGITVDGVVGAFIGGESVSVNCQPVRKISKNIRSAVAAALSSVAPGERPGHAVFVLADALACDGEVLIKEIKQSVPSDWPVFGGFAGDSWQFSRTRVFFNDTVFDDGAVIVYINDERAPAVRSRHGFAPVEESREMKVTGSDGNVVTTLDGKPALDVYTAELERLGLIHEGESFIQAAARYSLGIRSLWGEKLKIRTPMTASESGVVFAGAVPQGATVRVVCSSGEKMIEAAGQMMRDVVNTLDGVQPSAVIVVDCAVRWKLLNDRYHEQIEALISASRAPLIGFASYGEIAKCPGAMDGFHNTTSVAAVW